MKRTVIVTSALAVVLTFSAAIRAQPPATVAEAHKDIKATLGFVPTFFKAVPDEVLSAAWDEMRTLQLGTETALPNKTKELIGLGVSAQVPCRYCIYAHSQFAKANGATDRELREAVAMAALTRHWSTVLNGMSVDHVTFDKEIAKVFAHLASPKAAPMKEEPITDAASAHRDIERTLGSVPRFFSAMPASALAPAWREMKGLQLSTTTALDGKTKELIGLAVAAQIPCTYCVRFHTAAAKLAGATPTEIEEAVAMAALTRHWSTLLQGAQLDEVRYRREIDQIVKNTSKAKTPKQAAR
ncbi:MAG TPA: carboxymuconolactone decarboxylase family protein [Kofleriaceae bacterium]